MIADIVSEASCKFAHTSGRLARRKSLLGAEQNYYVQLYVENTGKPGDIRISEVSKSSGECGTSCFDIIQSIKGSTPAKRDA